MPHARGGRALLEHKGRAASQRVEPVGNFPVLLSARAYSKSEVSEG